MNSRHSYDRHPRGLTLIELLIVVFILLAVTAVAIPVMAPSLEERRLRETSRLVTSFFQGARTRAIQTGRPVGVWIEPMDSLTAASNTLFYAEVPPPYAGDSISSTIAVTSTGGVTGFTLGDLGWVGLIKPGDILKLGYKGPMFQIWHGEPYIDENGNGVWNTGEPYADVNADGTYDAPVAGDVDAQGFFIQGSEVRWTFTYVDRTFPLLVSITAGAYPFQIYRQPIKMAGQPLVLPEGRVIDLAASGTAGLAGTEQPPFIVLFSPGGSLTSLFHSTGALPITAPVFLHIGKVDKVASNTNWFDLGNLWVAIHPQTGLVTAAPSAAGDMNADGLIDASDVAQGGDKNGDGVVTISDSRYFAHQALSLGGR